MLKNRSEQLWPLNTIEIFMHLEVLVLSKLIENLVRVASRLLQVEWGNKMIEIGFTADIIVSLGCSGYPNPPSRLGRGFSFFSLIQCFLEALADSKLDEIWYNSCQVFKRASLPLPHCRSKGTLQQLLSSVRLATGGVAIGARLDHPCLDLEWCTHSTLLIQTSTMQSLEASPSSSTNSRRRTSLFCQQSLIVEKLE